MSKAMPKLLQRILLVIGILALVVLIIELVISIAATTHGNTPKRVVHVTDGPYALTVNLYDYPANAGFTLPFSIQAQPSEKITYSVFSIPTGDIPATPVRASIGPDANHVGGIQGDAEITVQGPWVLRIAVHGPAGSGTVDVPIVAAAPPADIPPRPHTRTAAGSRRKPHPAPGTPGEGDPPAADAAPE